MRNQLAAFSSIKDFDPESEFDGTIIRLPLRTRSQAARTKILASGKPTTDKEIIDIFRKFTGELVETLLFLKNLHTITLRVDDKIYAQAVSTTHSFREGSQRFEKANISAGYKRVFVERSNQPCSMDFVMNISLFRSETEQSDGVSSDQKFKFAISHHMRQGPEGRDLEKWSRSQKLFPWVAIATPLEVCHILAKATVWASILIQISSRGTLNSKDDFLVPSHSRFVPNIQSTYTGCFLSPPIATVSIQVVIGQLVKTRKPN